MWSWELVLSLSHVRTLCILNEDEKTSYLLIPEDRLEQSAKVGRRNANDTLNTHTLPPSDLSSDASSAFTIHTGRQRFLRYTIYFFFFLVWVILMFFVTARPAFHTWLADWKRWDAIWYEQIWLKGYPASDPRALVFPPGYSYLVGILAKLFSASFIGTAMVLNLVAFFATAALISDWFSQKFRVSPYLLFGFTLSAPASYIAFTSYSDIVFMLLLWVLLWRMLSSEQKSGRKPLIAQSLMLLVIPWIRLTGYALASWLLDRKVAAFAVIGSLALWLGFNRVVAGSPFYFLNAQEMFGMPEGNFFQGLFSSVARLFSNDLHNGFVTSWVQFAFLPLFYFGALTGAAIWLARRKEGLLTITVLSILILSHNQSVWRSVIRYDLPILPVLCLPLLVTSRSRTTANVFKAAFYLLMAGQFALQFYFARVFHSGGWAF